MMLSIGESRISSMKAKPVHNFPEEIIEDILLRLPVRSLLILKCVCKSWYSLISSNHFIQTHLRISKEHTNFDRRRVVFKDMSESAEGECQTAIKHCSLLPVLSGAVGEAVGCGIPMESTDSAEIISVCNGLICVLVYYRFVCLCNPSTREIKESPDFDEDIVGRIGIDMFGFGFDEATEDYKVVCVMAEDSRHTYHVSKVYSLQINTLYELRMMLSIGESRISSKKAKPELSAEIVQNFPEEIIEDILLRLPVRSLLILKCVCKSWYSLISSNHFIQTHLRISKENTNFDCRRVVFEDVSYSAEGKLQTAIKHCSFLPILSGEVTEAVDCGIPMESTNFADIIGVCNGLICVRVHYECICLCNPSTREIKKLPDLDYEIWSKHRIRIFGFGFDEATEDYKVVCAMAEDSRHTNPASKVYSLKSNSWKPIEILNEYVTKTDVAVGVFVSQKLHWSRRIGDSNKYELVSFDLSTEVWEKMEIPEFYGPQGFGYCVLFVFGGCLSALCKSLAQEVDLWVLKESGNCQSWEKLFHTPYFQTRLFKFDRSEFQLADGPNGTIVLLDCNCMDVFTYDLKDNSFTHLERMITDSSVYDEHIFIESLVPLT